LRERDPSSARPSSRFWNILPNWFSTIFENSLRAELSDNLKAAETLASASTSEKPRIIILPSLVVRAFSWLAQSGLDLSSICEMVFSERLEQETMMKERRIIMKLFIGYLLCVKSNKTVGQKVSALFSAFFSFLFGWDNLNHTPAIEERFDSF